MGRPSKFSEARATAIAESLRAGCTRRAACLSNGVSEDSLSRWIARFADFAERVARAEAEAEARHTATLQRAADGWDACTVTRTVKTVFKTRKTTTIDPETKQEVVVEEPVALEEVTETRTEARQFDWRAAESWLRRRRRDEWGDQIDVRKLPDDTLVRLLEGDARARGETPGPAPVGAADRNGAG